MTGNALHVHLAADGGICLVGPDHPSSWVTLDDLRTLLERRRGTAVELSGAPDAPLAAPAARVVEQTAGQVSPGLAPTEAERPHGSTALISIRLDHPGGTTRVSLEGRPAVAVIELLHRRLAERGVDLVGGWHLAFTEGSVDPVRHSCDPAAPVDDQ